MSDSCCTPDAQHHHHHDEPSLFGQLWPAVLSLVLLIAGLAMDYGVPQFWFNGWLRFVWYFAAYLPVGIPVLAAAVKHLRKGNFFNEFSLMGMATIGAFAIWEYPEGVAVMLFYSIGELFQDLAVSRARRNISDLLDQRPDEVTLSENGTLKTVPAAAAVPGNIILLKPGEKLALDGELYSDRAFFDTAALTGESVPSAKNRGETVLAGMINGNTVAEVRVTTAYQDSKLSRILQLVQEASARKAPTEQFIRKFAAIYTPVVFFLALGICLLPYFFVADYDFRVWLYRALVFLVISCPCALVISIPLGYFGGIGAASRNGILVKGGNYLDALAQLKVVVADKTGTLTEGMFQVQDVVVFPEFDRTEILKQLGALEAHSSHPVAQAICDFTGNRVAEWTLQDVQEFPGEGMKASMNGQILLAGNKKLLQRFGVPADALPEPVVTTVFMALNSLPVGYITIADRIRADSVQAVRELRDMGIPVVMLSGDHEAVVQQVAGELGIQKAYGGLLPEDKVEKLKTIRAQYGTAAFVGDGVNDAPVIALSDVGIAMGGLGSDAAIETAGVVIQEDRPSRIPAAIRIGRKTRRIVWQNIILAFGVKATVLILGAGGMASLWEAVFADVGVALLAILNAVRIQRVRY
ncbi:heavy metal translocating P-type ATPase [Chryseobacterium sp. MFBS3-17]|uniref:heavy metal translocating P-type ATPase n=1 Tax=Chryseobacterium sp. MFBS3-17 TaxID=2886689 RepID=UPI001D0E1795|nr:heavy metal translocating P-type ATPase [Chryseobacterium sp. MFBS3-17]MCC2590261.1 cadmium-translocating P-type ATPase [Chryseobacterium sp. MFBS3-17]